ncbi:metalloprotease PmbA [Buchnera aphidicola]|uniref:metalloprotease PmbA n=1 Tax=Buchnera aphidicola TaxID=9 RepID=UPI003464B0FE
MQLIQEIEQEKKFLINTVKKILELVKGKNCSIEVSIKKTIGININIRNNITEHIEYNRDGALLITVYKQFSKGSVSSKDFSLNSIKNMVDKALNIAKYSSSDFFSGLPELDLLYSQKIDLDLFHPLEFNINNSINLAVAAEQAAFNHDKRIINSEGSCFNSHINIIVFGNSLGMLESYKSTRHSLYTCVIAEENNIMQRDFDYSVSRKIEDLDASEIIGKKTATRAIARLGSKKIKSIKSPVIFSSNISSSLFSHLVKAISGYYVHQKSTLLINDFKKNIFPNWLDIEENPHIKKGLGSKPFDGEGVATRVKNIIKNGVLETWLLNSYIARKMKTVSTGNAGGIYNWFIKNKNLSFIELLKKMHKGLLITELMGQGVDIISGNYSRGAVGFWIDHGQIQYPVHEITISGNLKNMWKNIVSISNDIDERTNIQCGSILISEMQISGN